VQFLAAASGGLLGEVVRIVVEAAEAAISDGTEQIALPHLEQAGREHR
jgi:hypothetical protein